MRIVEIRDYDGPNLYLPGPAIKVEFADVPAESDSAQAVLQAVSTRIIAAAGGESALVLRLDSIHGRLAVAFAWSHRRADLEVASLLAEVLVSDHVMTHSVTGEPDLDHLNGRIEGIRSLRGTSDDPDDAPRLYQAGNRHPGIVAITGTNGKTTTTRLVAHMLRSAGRSVGWTSTAGVFVNGEVIDHGDWSGPGGAWLLFDRPGLDWAILETARGGILRRGLAYDAADVSVFTNVSPDHLGEQGVFTVEQLAEVKSVVTRATRTDGMAVLNADDPLVLAAAAQTTAGIILISQQADQPAVQAHLASGGTALTSESGSIVWRRGDESRTVVRLVDVPSTFGGRATHMVENVLCGAAAAIGCGLSLDEIAHGLRKFGQDHQQNQGRLNFYDVSGVRVIADYAHNEAGLRHLLQLATGLCPLDNHVWAVLGTAGDRSDTDLAALAQIAVGFTDRIVAKGTRNYLRGRPAGQMELVIAAAATAAGAPAKIIAPDEITALRETLTQAQPGDLIALMCVDQPAEVAELLAHIGSPIDPSTLAG